jgi:hypothetical protein
MQRTGTPKFQQCGPVGVGAMIDQLTSLAATRVQAMAFS